MRARRYNFDDLYISIPDEYRASLEEKEMFVFVSSCIQIILHVRKMLRELWKDA